MRRLAVCAFVALAAGLVLASAAPASAAAKHAAAGARRGSSTATSYQRLGNAAYDISGHVLNYNGTPRPGAKVDWGWWTGQFDYHFGGTNTSVDPSGTGSDGAFHFSGVVGWNKWGDDLTVYYNPAEEWFGGADWFNLDFTDNNNATPRSYELQPAHVMVDVANAPATQAEVTVGYGDIGYAWTTVNLGGGQVAADVLAMSAPPAPVPPAFDDVVAYAYDWAGSYATCIAQTEWLGASPVNVSAGATAAGTVNLDWSKAQHAYLAGPTCRRSGKPGTTVKMVLKGWPAGEQAGFIGDPGGTPCDYSAVVHSTGAGNTYVASLRIPTNAPVDTYEIDTYRIDSPDSFVQLWDFFQVCTFKASASAIRHGKTVRLSGRVPAGAGYVTLYSRTRAAGQPATLAAKGWVKAARCKIKSGKFRTGLLHPRRTTWYVAKYAGYDFPAFTSVVRVRVH